MPVKTSWAPYNEKSVYLRGLAGLHAKMPSIDAKERGLYYAMAADREEQTLWEEKAIKNYLRTGDPNPRRELEQKGLSSLSDTAGGYAVNAVPPAEILAKGASDLNPIRPYATVVTLTTGDIYPQPVEKTRPGVRRVRETDSHATPTSDMLLAGEGIPVHIYNSTLPVSSKLVQDAAYDPDIVVIQPVMRAFLVAESTDFVVGSGVGQPEGMFSNGAVSLVHSGSASTITADSIRAMFYGLPAAFRNNGYWLMNDSTIQVIKTLKDSTGAYLYDRGIFGLVPETLMGRPILSCPDAPNVAGGAYPIVLGDLSRYVIVDRTPLAVLVDPYSNKPNFIYDCMRRVGGQVVDPTAFVKMVIAT
ncbi:MAG: phage major capsid protein [Nitrospirota bacterium]|nr:phage major capsid protein [Nitrospirota bacterium]